MPLNSTEKKKIETILETKKAEIIKTINNKKEKEIKEKVQKLEKNPPEIYKKAMKELNEIQEKIIKLNKEKENIIEKTREEGWSLTTHINSKDEIITESKLTTRTKTIHGKTWRDTSYETTYDHPEIERIEEKAKNNIEKITKIIENSKIELFTGVRAPLEIIKNIDTESTKITNE